MKVAIMSDIHANLPALTAVLAAAKEAGVVHILACGDFIGYYHAPRRCLDLLADWPLESCRGNHDGTLHSPDAVINRYGSGARVARETLDDSQIRWLDSLCDINDVEISERKARLCHGAPWDAEHYLYPDAAEIDKRRAARGQFDLVALGHTHYPMIERFGNTWLVNPGSVGQQRNGIPGAHWALWDTEPNEVCAITTPYDPSQAAEDAQRLDPHLPYLVDVLFRGVAR